MANRRTDSITIAELSAGCNHVRQLEDRYGANVILESLRPLAGLSFTSVVIRTAERVAAVDRKLGSSPGRRSLGARWLRTMPPPL